MIKKALPLGELAAKQTERVTMQIPKDNSQLSNARALRKNMTPQERHLWYDFLRDYPIKIYKQRIIGRYIADFYCASAKLVIEIDGSQHYDEAGARHDAERSAFLEHLGLTVVRYSNADVNVRFREVCEEIDRLIRERTGIDPLRQR